MMALVMLLVELVQRAVITGRAFDVDDVLLNTSGALLGYLLIGRQLSRALYPGAATGGTASPNDRPLPPTEGPPTDG
ncbi:hypothetical protein QFZ76_000765 [Streptomyces sp. V4I2]|nr:hypothetical protein [Streptomyces sp. V4I2]